MGLDLYYQKLSDFILFSPQDSTTISFANGGTSTNAGGELEIGVRFFRKWEANFTYAYQKIADNEAFLGFEQASPSTKLTLGLHRNAESGLFLNIWAYYIGETAWYIAQPGQMPAVTNVPSFVTVNAYFGYALNSKMRMGISISDLLNTNQNQFPFAERSGRIITAGLEANF